MLLALMQANAAVLDVEENLATLEAAAAAAAESGAAMLLTPELFLVGYAPARLRAHLDPTSLPAVHQRVAAIAVEHHIAIAFSLPAVTESGELTIAATLVDDAGTVILTYAKVHLFGPEERAAFVPGALAPTVVQFQGMGVCLAICYDIEFPEVARAAALAGADLLLVPTALAHGFDAVPQVLVRARALESQLTIAYANHSGVEDGCTFLGGSVIAAPDGGLLAAAGTAPEILLAEVSAAAASAARSAVPYLAERRPDLYGSWGL